MTTTTPVQSSSWVSLDRVIDKLGTDAPKDDSGQVLLQSQIDSAVELLYALSGRQFPGSVSAIVRPTSRPQGCPDLIYDRYLAAGGGFGWNVAWRWGTCGGGFGCTGCCGPTAIGLGRSPISTIEWVQIDGEELDQTEYRVDDAKWLVRQECNVGWPTCQDLSCPLGDPCTFGVNFTFGQDPPQSGVDAALILAAEFYRSSQPGMTCQLPQRVTSITRQGVSFAILDPQTFLQAGRTGIYQVDMFLRAYNPNGQIRRPMVWSPDVPNMARRTTMPVVNPL
jgi:hypothetical protein